MSQGDDVVIVVVGGWCRRAERGVSGGTGWISFKLMVIVFDL